MTLVNSERFFLKKIQKVLFYFCFSLLCTVLISSESMANSSVSLAWSASDDGVVAGYKLYYMDYHNPNGTDPLIFGQQICESPIDIPVDQMADPGQPAIEIAGLQSGITYQFVLTAYSSSGLESSLPSYEEIEAEKNNPTSDNNIYFYTLHTVSITSSEAGILSQEGDTLVSDGGSFILDVTPDPSSYVDVVDVIINGVSYGAISSKLLEIDQSYDISVIVEKRTYAIETISSGNGEIIPGGELSFEHGSSQIFTIQPDENHKVLDVLIDGISKGPVFEYTLENIDRPHTIEAKFVQSAPQIALEADEITVDHNWKRVTFQNSYTDPVVVAGSLSFNGEDPAVVRIDNVTSNGFDICLQEWDYLDDQHTLEKVGYLVMESGIHTLEDGTQIRAGTVHTDTTTSFEHVYFDGNFNTTPVVMAISTTFNGSDAVTVRMRDVNRWSFELMLEEQEANTDLQHSTETVSYIAWEPSMGTIGDTTFEVNRAPSSIDENDYYLSFDQYFSETPGIISAMQTAYGPDTASVRWHGKTKGGLYLQLVEEQSRDDEINHCGESLGYMTFLPGN